MIRWFLVEQYADQLKITLNTDRISLEKQITNCSGPRSVEVEINGLYSPIHGASLFAHLVELQELRRRLYGAIIPVRSLRY